MSQLRRALKIQRTLFKHKLDELAWSQPLLKPIRPLRKLFPWRWFRKEQPPTGAEIREALIELGPIFVKFGQMLSTRADLLPEDFAKELAKLQDKVPPFDPKLAREAIESCFGQPVERVFAKFDETPLASASIAQVHAATLHTGEQVVVKVLRPNIEKQIQLDVRLMMTFAKLLHKGFPGLRRYRPIDVVKEFRYTLTHELDLLREAANASQLRRNFEGSDLIYVPKMHWEYCHANVMVQERVFGAQITDMDTLKAHGVNLKVLAEKGVEIFFTQVFRDCFFHADMHPGNVFVMLDDPENPKYAAVDFGIMGTLNPADQKYLAANFLAFFNRDYRKVAELHIDSGWIPSYVRIDEFESSIRTVCEPIFEKPLRDLSFGRSLLKLFQTARQFDMEIQPQLLLLQKTLLSVEGLGKQLYPELDLWANGKPFFEKWMKAHMGPRALKNTLIEKAPHWINKMPEVPDAIYDIVHHWQQQVKESKTGRHLVPQKKPSRPIGTIALTLTLGFAFIVTPILPNDLFTYLPALGGLLCVMALWRLLQ